jgi:SAM-dependent methyltransferase
LTTYDETPYPSDQHADLHPAAIGAWATLCGLSPPRQAYRALEIGCGEGVNLMAMAEAAPESEFVGFDLAPTAIAAARATASAAAIANVRFETRDLTQVGAEFGRFDYVVAHGVLAWTPAPVRAALMRLAGTCLTERGLAVVTYNVAPGCGLRAVIREILLREIGQERAPRARLAEARRRLADLAARWNVDDPYRQALRKEALSQLAKPEAVLFHDELGAVYAPQRFSEVAAAAAAAGLDYVCDAEGKLLAEALEPDLVESGIGSHAPGEGIGQADWIAREQERDIRVMRRFRRSVFARAGAPVARGDVPARWAGLWVQGEISRLAPTPEGRPHRFQIGLDGEAEVEDVGAAQALDRLAAARPGAAPYDELASLCGHAALRRLVAGGALRLRLRPPVVALSLPERPRVGGLALALVRRGAPAAPTRSVGSLKLGDDAARHLFLLCDGTRRRDDLAEAMAARLHAPLAEAARGVDALLAHFQTLGAFAP